MSSFLVTARAFATANLAFWSIGGIASELAVRESPESYRHTCTVDGAVLGVDYLRRSLPTPRGMQHIPGVLIVELGIFPTPGRSVKLPAGNFELDWKGRERPLTPAGPELVAAQLLHGEWAREATIRMWKPRPERRMSTDETGA